ncbi:unnamed protein product [Linum trigynum]|uniref:Uncharacterized protein n=1 Tax=Linum trigynum TaxID=586398 RepID=A0AAV2ERD2_9ROSI
MGNLPRAGGESAVLCGGEQGSLHGDCCLRGRLARAICLRRRAACADGTEALAMVDGAALPLSFRLFRSKNWRKKRKGRVFSFVWLAADQF